MLKNNFFGENEKQKILTFLWIFAILLAFVLEIFLWRSDCFYCTEGGLLIFAFIYFCFVFLFIVFFFFSFPGNTAGLFLKNLLFFAMLTFFSVLISIDFNFSLFGSVRFFLMSFPLIYISLVIPNPKRFLIKIGTVLSFLGVLSALFAIFLMLFGKVEEGFPKYQDFVFSFFSFYLGKFRIYQRAMTCGSFPIIFSFFSNQNLFGFWLFITISFTFFLSLCLSVIALLVNPKILNEVKITNKPGSRILGLN